MTRLIDCHVHLVTGNPAYPKSLEVGGLLALMDEAGVHQAVIVQSRSGNGLESQEPSLGAQFHPSRLVAVCGVNLEGKNPETALRLRVQTWGARGARVFWGSRSLLDEELAAFWRCAIEMDVPILVAGQARFAEAGALCQRYPRLRIVLDHCGDPPDLTVWEDDLLQLASVPNLFLKYSSHLHERIEAHRQQPRQMLEQLIQVFGAERLIWGSNYPASHEPRWTYAGAANSFLALIHHQPDSIRDALCRETALRLWPALATDPPA